MNSQEEIELFEAAKNYTICVHKELLCKPFQQRIMTINYEKSLERLGAASLDYSRSVKSFPYNDI